MDVSVAEPLLSAELVSAASDDAGADSVEVVLLLLPPHAVRPAVIARARIKAIDKGITNSVASCTMYIELGRMLYMSQGSEKNLKLTTSEDIEIFKALLNSKKR